MKNLKKWTALAAVMAMTATLFTGCGSTDTTASEAATTAAESTASATTEAATEASATDGELAADVQAGVVAVDIPFVCGVFQYRQAISANAVNLYCFFIMSSFYFALFFQQEIYNVFLSDASPVNV